MDLPTYTNIWRIEKRLYKLYDFRLPMPLPVGTFGVALGVFALWVVLLSILNAPFDFGNGWHLVLWVVPPGVITVLATRPVIEGKRLTELLVSQARFLTESRVYTRLAPEYEPAEIRVSVRVWHRDPAIGPLPLTRSAARRAQAEEAAVLEPAAGAETSEAVEAAEGEGIEDVPARGGRGTRGTGRRAAPAAAPPLRGVPEPKPDSVVSSEPAPAPASERVPAAEPVPVAEPAPEPTSAPEPVTAVSAAEPAPEPEPVSAHGDAVDHTPARRIPVAAVSGAHVTAGPGTPPIQEDDAVAESRNEPGHRSFTADDTPGHLDERPRGVGRRVLNYFGFGLGPAADADPAGLDDHGHGDRGRDNPDDRDRGHRLRERDLADEDADFGEPLYVTEEDEQRDRDEWFAQLKASSGETPLGLTSKGAYASSDTGAMSSAELADAVSPREPGTARKGPGARRRAEEIMAAPVAGDPVAEGTGEDREDADPGEESAAARRLRGRVQGIRVARDHADRRERGAEEAPAAEEGGADTEASQRSAPVRERAPQTPPARPARARGQALPDTGAEDDRPARARRQGRPHAAPWALGSEGEQAASDRTDYPDLSDYAARYAAATGRPSVARNVSAAPWLPPASATPEESEEGRRSGPRGARPDRREAEAPRRGTDQDRRDAAPTRTTGEVGDDDRIGRSEAGPQASHAANSLGATTSERTEAERFAAEPAVSERSAAEHADTSEAPDTPAARVTDTPASPVEGAAKPPLQLDHGTGEHEAMPVEPEEEDPAERGPEWSEHMSVLDQHLITADTPAPPRPKFADAVPTEERDDGRRDPSEWFDDGKRRHPDQPKVGDRNNPVIAVSELREERRAAAEAREQEAREREAREQEARERADRERAVREQEAREQQAREEAIRKEAEDADRRAAEAAEAAAAALVDEPKPSTQLDHGTGELVSFVEVRKDPRTPVPRSTPGASKDRSAEAASRAVRSEPAPGGTAYGVTEPASPATGSVQTSAARQSAGEAPAARPTEAELAEAEAAALRARRARSGSEARTERAPEAPGSGAPVRSDRLARTMRAASTAPATSDTPATRTTPATSTTPASPGETTPKRTAAQSPARASTPADRSAAQDAPAPAAPGEHDPHDGVFHRVAQNARRIGQLFGQPTPGEEPAPPRRAEPGSAEDPAKPDLELDHGTGEQARLGDTPTGVPSQRPEPRPAKRAEEPAAPTGGAADSPSGGNSSASGGTRGWRRLAKVVTGGAAPVRSDLPDSDIERLRTPLTEPRSLVVLGCTGGAGQTVTALMIGHTLAAHRDDRVVAVDVNPGPNGLSRRVGAQAPETLTALLANADSVDEYDRMRSYAGRAGTGLEVVQTLDDPYVQTLDDRDYGQLTELLGGFYGVTLLDPAATGVARSLPVADGLVLVAPASSDAERAVSMTFEWLDGNGYAGLRANSILVVNGVSKRSLQDVDAAERVARGRCRAIVRIPWDDHLGSSYTKIDVGALRPATKRAHGALGGVLVNALAPATTT